MSKRKLAGLICVFAAVVLIVLAFALPIYKTAPRVQDYNGKDAVIAASDGFLFYAYGKTEALSHFRGKDLFSDDELQNRVAALTGLSKQFSDKGSHYHHTIIF